MEVLEYFSILATSGLSGILRVWLDIDFLFFRYVIVQANQREDRMGRRYEGDRWSGSDQRRFHVREELDRSFNQYRPQPIGGTRFNNRQTMSSGQQRRRYYFMWEYKHPLYLPSLLPTCIILEKRHRCASKRDILCSEWTNVIERASCNITSVVWRFSREV